MKTYNVKEVAQLLNTSEETVRRWIRNGKLQATMDSRKKGSVITEVMLKEFAEEIPKYSMALDDSVSGAVVNTAALLGTLVSAAMARKAAKNAKVEADEVEKILLENIKESKAMIKRKKNSLSQLEEEIKRQELELQNLQYLLKEIRKNGSNINGGKSDE